MADKKTDTVLDTIPKLVAYHAESNGEKPAYREKEYGIWQSWTWNQVGNEITNLALGLLSLGINEGDHIAVIGSNRPHLYWAMIASQSVSAIPVPLYQDAVSEEISLLPVTIISFTLN